MYPMTKNLGEKNSSVEKSKFSLPPSLCLKGGPLEKEIKEKRLFLAAGSQIMGDVSFGEDVSIWFNAVVRADLLSISLGDSTNVQDGVILHVSNDLGCKIGSFVTIGHGAVVHAATLEEGVLVGMKSVVLDGAVIGRGSIIAAGAVIRKGEKVEPFSLMAGVPAKKIRTLPQENFEENLNWAKKYVLLKDAYLKNNLK